MRAVHHSSPIQLCLTGCFAVFRVCVQHCFYHGASLDGFNSSLVPSFLYSSAFAWRQTHFYVVKSSRCSPLAALVCAVGQLVVEALGVWHKAIALPVHSAWQGIGHNFHSACARQCAR